MPKVTICQFQYLVNNILHPCLTLISAVHEHAYMCAMKRSILIDRLHVGWVKCKWCCHNAPCVKRKLHTSLMPVFLDILLFDELEGTCLVCEWALSTAWCQKLSFYQQHRGVQELLSERQPLYAMGVFVVQSIRCPVSSHLMRIYMKIFHMCINNRCVPAIAIWPLFVSQLKPTHD